GRGRSAVCTPPVAAPAPDGRWGGGSAGGGPSCGAPVRRRSADDREEGSGAWPTGRRGPASPLTVAGFPPGSPRPRSSEEIAPGFEGAFPPTGRRGPDPVGSPPRTVAGPGTHGSTTAALEEIAVICDWYFLQVVPGRPCRPRGVVVSRWGIPWRRGGRTGRRAR